MCTRPSKAPVSKTLVQWRLSRESFESRLFAQGSAEEEELLHPRKMVRVQLLFPQHLVQQNMRNIHLTRNPASARSWVVQRTLNNFLLHRRNSNTTRTSTTTSRHNIAGFPHPPNRCTNDIRVRMTIIWEELRVRCSRSSSTSSI